MTDNNDNKNDSGTEASAAENTSESVEAASSQVDSETAATEAGDETSQAQSATQEPSQDPEVADEIPEAPRVIASAPAAASAASGAAVPAEPTANTQAGANGELYGYLAEFENPGALIKGAEAVRDCGFANWDCYSPFPVHGIDPAMGIKRTVLPLIVFAGGFGGLSLGLFLQWWTNAFDWKWIVSGKPFFSLPANIPITFETTVLLSAFTAFLGMWALNKLPQVWHPLFRSNRFRKVTDDGFFIGVEAADDSFDTQETAALLRGAGATHIEKVYLDPDPIKKQIPKPVIAFIIMTTVMALVPFALIARARASKSDKPHYHIIPDMDFQHKTKSQRASELFPDRRGSQMPVEGTVARGQDELKADDHFYRGIVKEGERSVWATTFPTLESPARRGAPAARRFTVDRRTMKRGKERYDIYCAPCHGYDGAGEGMIQRRINDGVPMTGWVKPANLLDARIIQQPHGVLFNTISNGKSTMLGYASQIPEQDRWAIILYVRALQRSQSATESDRRGQ